MSAAVESAPMANSTPTEGATAGAGSEQPTSSSQNQEVLASAAEGQTTPKPNVGQSSLFCRNTTPDLTGRPHL